MRPRIPGFDRLTCLLDLIVTQGFGNHGNIIRTVTLKKNTNMNIYAQTFKSRFQPIIVAIALLAPFSLSRGQAVANWDMTGQWTITAFIEDGTWGPFTFNVTTEDFANGTFGGVAVSYPGAPWISGDLISGQTTQSNVSFGLFDRYGERTFNGSFAADGTMSGGVIDESGIWHGTFSTLAGAAVPVAVPEPSTYAAILGAAALGFVMLRRRLNRKLLSVLA